MTFIFFITFHINVGSLLDILILMLMYFITVTGSKNILFKLNDNIFTFDDHFLLLHYLIIVYWYKPLIDNWVVCVTIWRIWIKQSISMKFNLFVIWFNLILYSIHKYLGIQKAFIRFYYLLLQSSISCLKQYIYIYYSLWIYYSCRLFVANIYTSTK